MREYEFIAEALAQVAPYVREMYARRDRLEVSTKRDANDLLTEVDVETQRRLVTLIEAAFPGDRIIGEEEGYDTYPEDPDARCWLLDPIDGTQNFVRNVLPEWGISVAFAEGNRPMAGGVCLAAADKTFLAGRGLGATLDGVPIRVSDTDRLDAARVEIDWSRRTHRTRTLSTFGPVAVACGSVRSHGAAVVGIASVAAGCAEAYLHASLTPWDYAAAQLMVEEAGGQATRIDGSPIRLWDDRLDLLITNGRVHDAIRRIVATAPPGA